VTRYDFTENRFKGWFVGGAQRWESKSVIGYYGKVSGFNGAQMDVSDTTRPIYDSANYYTDLFVGYQRKIWNNKVGLKVQLNVDNVLENGSLMPVAVNYDGSPYAFRIVDPRRFILSAAFDF
jgi:outer membrane receptor for monomeric catechols